MVTGHEVTAVYEGLLIPEPVVRPLGIRDGTECWGVFIPDPERPIAPAHVLISTIPPSTWGSLIQFEFRLRDHPQSLLRAAEVLASKGVDVLSSHNVATGHTHTTWTGVGHITEMEGLANKQRERALAAKNRDTPNSRDERLTGELRALGTTLAEEVLRRSWELVSSIVNEHGVLRKAGEDYLHRRFMGPVNPLYNEGERPVADLHRKLAMPFDKAVTFRWLTDLAYFWMHGTDVGSPMVFQFESGTSTLRTASREYRVNLRRCGADAPLPVTATVDAPGSYLRVAFQEQRSRYFADFQYDAELSKGNESTHGLLAEALRGVAGAGLRVKHMRNAIRRRARQHEVGEIFLVTESAGDVEAPRSAQKLEGRLNAIHEVDGSEAIIHQKTNVGVVGARRLFVSHLTKWVERDKGRRPALDAMIRRHGFVPVWVDSTQPAPQTNAIMRNITLRALESINVSDAFLQVVPRLSEEEEDSAAVWQWLLYEWGSAAGRGLPIARCLDAELQVGLAAKQLMSVGDGQTIYTFDSELPPAEVAGALEPAVIWLTDKEQDRKPVAEIDVPKTEPGGLEHGLA